MQVDDKLDELEWVSAMADDELGSETFAAVAGSIVVSDEARTAWHAYHVIGDVLRCADLPDCAGDKAFVGRLRERLATQESRPQPAHELIAQRAVQVLPVEADVRSDPGKRFARQSANDPVVQWKWLAMAASLAAVAVLGWQVSKPVADTGASLAQAVPAVRPAVVAQPPVMLRDPRLDELLAAHRQSGGASALPTSAGFLRNATFEQPGR